MTVDDILRSPTGLIIGQRFYIRHHFSREAAREIIIRRCGPNPTLHLIFRRHGSYWLRTIVNQRGQRSSPDAAHRFILPFPRAPRGQAAPCFGRLSKHPARAEDCLPREGPPIAVLMPARNRGSVSRPLAGVDQSCLKQAPNIIGSLQIHQSQCDAAANHMKT